MNSFLFLFIVLFIYSFFIIYNIDCRPIYLIRSRELEPATSALSRASKIGHYPFQCECYLNWVCRNSSKIGVQKIYKLNTQQVQFSLRFWPNFGLPVAIFCAFHFPCFKNGKPLFFALPCAKIPHLIEAYQNASFSGKTLLSNLIN